MPTKYETHKLLKRPILHFFLWKKKNSANACKSWNFKNERKSGKKSPYFSLLLSALHLNVASASCLTPFHVMMVLATRDTLFIFFSFVLHFLKLFRCSKAKPGPMHSWDELCIENAWETLVYDGFICLNGSFVSVKRNQYANVRSFYCLHNANAMAAAAVASLYKWKIINLLLCYFNAKTHGKIDTSAHWILFGLMDFAKLHNWSGWKADWLTQHCINFYQTNYIQFIHFDVQVCSILRKQRKTNHHHSHNEKTLCALCKGSLFHYYL